MNDGLIAFDVRACPVCALPVEQSKWGVVSHEGGVENFSAYWRVDEAHTAPCGALCVEGQPVYVRNESMHGYLNACRRCGVVTR